MNIKDKYLIVVSFDALNSHDFEKLKNYPNFKRFLSGSSYSNEVTSISPSLTYPAHTSIITSCHPNRHGVISNTLMQPNRLSPDWNWHRKRIKVDTLYDIALKNNLTVAALLWPVTAKSKITYNFPEIFANRPWKNQIAVSLLNGSLSYQYKLNKMFSNLRQGISQPYLDDFVEASLIYTIENLKANLILVHFVDLDSMRHYYGFDSKEADMALSRHDKRLGNILYTLEKENMLDNTTLVVLGDHSMKPTHSVISLPRLFKDKGIQKYKKEKLIDREVLTKSNDGSTYIYIKDKSKIKNIKILLEEFASTSNAIDAILEKTEILDHKADPNADFLIDAKEGYYFTDKLETNVVNKVEVINGKVKPGYLLSSHGYLKDKKDYYTVFAIKGPGIKKNYEIGPMSLVDEGVTLAKVMNLDMRNVDGNIIQGIFEDEN